MLIPLVWRQSPELEVDAEGIVQVGHLMSGDPAGDVAGDRHDRDSPAVASPDACHSSQAAA